MLVHMMLEYIVHFNSCFIWVIVSAIICHNHIRLKTWNEPIHSCVETLTCREDWWRLAGGTWWYNADASGWVKLSTGDRSLEMGSGEVQRWSQDQRGYVGICWWFYWWINTRFSWITRRVCPYPVWHGHWPLQVEHLIDWVKVVRADAASDGSDVHVVGQGFEVREDQSVEANCFSLLVAVYCSCHRNHPNFWVRSASACTQNCQRWKTHSGTVQVPRCNTCFCCNCIWFYTAVLHDDSWAVPATQRPLSGLQGNSNASRVDPGISSNGLTAWGMGDQFAQKHPFLFGSTPSWETLFKWHNWPFLVHVGELAL